MKAPAHVVAELGVLGDAFGGPRWAQGLGGSASVKDDGIVWVKASGRRLADVAEEDAHVGIDLAEADLHALGGRVVAQTHPVPVLLAACSTRPASELGFPVVPYERPGRGRAVAVARALEAAPDARAVVLESDGLLAFGDTAADAVATTRDVAERSRAAFGADLATFDDLLAEYTSRAIIEVDGGFGRRLPSRPHLGRYLFPDAVVFASVVRVRRIEVEPLPGVVAQLGRSVVVVDDANGRLAFGRTRGALEACIEVLAAHDWVEATLSRHGMPRYLSSDEAARIVES